MYHNIKVEMAKQKKTVRSLAADLGIHENTLRRILNEETTMTVPVLKRICGVLNKSMLYLSETDTK